MSTSSITKQFVVKEYDAYLRLLKEIEEKELIPMSKVGNRELPTRNDEGYMDKTAYNAIKNIQPPTDAESERFNKLLHSIRNICDLAGFRIDNRIVLIDKETDRVWR